MLSTVMPPSCEPSALGVRGKARVVRINTRNGRSRSQAIGRRREARDLHGGLWEGLVVECDAGRYPSALPGAHSTFVAMNNVVNPSVSHLLVHAVPRTTGDALSR